MMDISNKLLDRGHMLSYFWNTSKNMKKKCMKYVISEIKICDQYDMPELPAPIHSYLRRGYYFSKHQ